MARNLDSGQLIATRVSVTATRAERARGLLGRGSLPPDEGLWITPSRGVHTCWMRFPIDLVALDATGTIIDWVVGLRPWRIRLPQQHVVGVLELAEGTLHRSDTRLGHRLGFEPVDVLSTDVQAGDH